MALQFCVALKSVFALNWWNGPCKSPDITLQQTHAAICENPFYTPSPTEIPTINPTTEHTAEPIIEPTADPTIEPTSLPTIAPMHMSSKFYEDNAAIQPQPSGNDMLQWIVVTVVAIIIIIGVLIVIIVKVKKGRLKVEQDVVKRNKHMDIHKMIPSGRRKMLK